MRVFEYRRNQVVRLLIHYPIPIGKKRIWHLGYSILLFELTAGLISSRSQNVIRFFSSTAAAKGTLAAFALLEITEEGEADKTL